MTGKMSVLCSWSSLVCIYISLSILCLKDIDLPPAEHGIYSLLVEYVGLKHLTPTLLHRFSFFTTLLPCLLRFKSKRDILIGGDLVSAKEL